MNLSTRASRLPLWIGTGFLLFTYVLFFIGPFEWPLLNWWPIYLYLPLVFATLIGAHLLAIDRPAHGAPFPKKQLVFRIGALCAILILFPSAQMYTGRWPWQVFEALQDQRGAYRSLADQLLITTGSRGPLALARALVAPLVFAVLPLGIIYWRHLSPFDRALLCAAVLCSIVFSILRGTTRELADLVVIGGSAGLIALARRSGGARVDLASIFARYSKSILIGLVLGLMVIGALVARTETRLGQTNNVCIGESFICADFNRPPYNRTGDSLDFSIATISGYLSQGYYGLALAMNMDFKPTLGVGHSPAISSLYVRVTGDETLPRESYTYRLGDYRWNDATQWSSLMVWVANDVGFIGVIPFIGLVGWLWGLAWNDATRGYDDRAAIFFCITMMMIFYLPANNQMMATFDSYSTLLVWAFIWLFARLKRPRAPA